MGEFRWVGRATAVMLDPSAPQTQINAVHCIYDCSEDVIFYQTSMKVFVLPATWAPLPLVYSSSNYQLLSPFCMHFIDTG